MCSGKSRNTGRARLHLPIDLHRNIYESQPKILTATLAVGTVISIVQEKRDSHEMQVFQLENKGNFM